MTIDDNSIAFVVHNHVGKFEVVEGIFFQTTTKPNFIHRFFCKLLLGWKWTDKHE